MNINNKIRLLKLTFIVLSLPCIVYPSSEKEENKVDVMCFDTVFELNSPMGGDSSILFARYWVSKDFYSIGFQWGEPFIGGINFPTYPAGVTINSNKDEFSTTSQVIESHNNEYSKPIEERGVFRHSLGSYPFRNIRYAEGDALEDRVYFEDLKSASEPDSNQVEICIIADSNDNKDIERNVKKIYIKRNNNNIEDLMTVDVNGIILKNVSYVYSQQDGKTQLKKETVFMPEKRMWVGFNGKGATITLNGQKKTYRELLGFHHTGGRISEIEYTSLETENKQLPTPSSIEVKRADADYTLRNAKMSNYKLLKMTQEEAQKQALEFSRLDEKELRVRNLFEKYWMKNSDDVNDIDKKELANLRKYFDNKTNDKNLVSEKLKNNSMLMELDWIQNNSELDKRFGNYLDILEENDHKNIMLNGGMNLIGITVRWKMFSQADKQLQKWIDKTIRSFKYGEILRFSETLLSQKNYWIVINLLDNYLKSKECLKAELFDVLAMKYMALFEQNKLAEDPSKIEQDSIRSQIEWALSSKSREELIQSTNETLSQAIKAYSDLKEPNELQKTIKKKMDQITSGAKEKS